VARLVKVAWTDRALNDLHAVGDYIALDNPAAAEKWVNRLLRTAESIATLPLAARVVPELGRPDVRETFERTYRIVYLVRANSVLILTVFEGHRCFPDDIRIDEDA
jgi:plasmid stabilization system protein ParE